MPIVAFLLRFEFGANLSQRFSACSQCLKDVFWSLSIVIAVADLRTLPVGLVLWG